MSTKDDALIEDMAIAAYGDSRTELSRSRMRRALAVARKAILEEAASDRAALVEALKKISRSRNRNLTAPNKLAAIYEIVDAALATQEQNND